MQEDRRRFVRDITAASAGLAVSSAWAVQGRPVRCRVVEARSGQPLVARVRLLDSQGREVVPAGHPEKLGEDAHEGDVRFQARRFAYVNGGFEVDPRMLPLKYQVIKGYEYGIAEGEITAEALKDGSFTIGLSRWSELARRGWYSGDVHIHFIAPKTCRMEMDAEDLNVANILTGDFTPDVDQFEGKPNANSSGRHIVYVTQEFRNHELGHMCLLNLKKLVEPVKTVQPYHYPLHLDVCDKAHAQGGYVTWAHFPSWPGVENPLDVAMEKLDGLEILSVLDPRDFPIFMKSVVPELESNHGLRLWYRYLNCGFRLTPTAGTDKMTTFVTVGANRVFARIDGDFTYDNWIAALKAGRTFISNSPILSFSVNGREPGAALQLSSRKDKALRIHATAESQIPYTHLEIVSNGQVIGQARPGGSRNRAEIHLEHPFSKSCWLAARVLEDIDPYRNRGIQFSKVHSDDGTLVSNYYGHRRPETVFAHTSPVYVIRDSEPIRNWDDAQYYIRYLDNSIHWLKTEAKFARPADQEASIEAFQRGKAIYEKRAAEARRG